MKGSLHQRKQPPILLSDYSYFLYYLISNFKDLFQIWRAFLRDKEWWSETIKTLKMMGYGDERILRTFVFEREDTHQSILMELEVDLSTELININSFLSRICPLRSCRVAIYDPAINGFIDLTKIGMGQGIVAKRFI
jgi:hypothetical protein